MRTPRVAGPANREPVRNAAPPAGKGRSPTVIVTAVFRRHATAPAIVAGAISIGFVLAGCGGSGDDPEDGAPAGSSVTTASAAGSTPSGSQPGTTPAGSDAPVVTAGDGPGASTDVMDGTTGSTTAAAPTTPSDPTAPAAAVPTALDFAATLIDGSEIEMGQYAGRPVLLWFWAPW